MPSWFRQVAVALIACLSFSAVSAAPVPAKKAKAQRPAVIHRVAIQVDQEDPAVMNLALNNATNVIE